MGRKASAASTSKKGELAHTPKATNPSSESVEAHSAGPNASSERVEQQVERASPPPEKTNSKIRVQESSNSRKKPKHSSVVVRRSLRIQNCVTPVRNQNIQPMIEEITVVDSEMEDEQPILEEHLNGPNLEEQCNEPNLEEQFNEPNMGEQNMEEKMDYVIQLLETLNSKATKRSFMFSENPDLRYKSLYIDSQKKIEELTNENRELSLKLEAALGKLEGYEKGTHAISETMEKLKDVILVSSLSKATGGVVDFSSLAPCDALSPQDAVQDPKSAAKRKKQS